MSIIKSIKYSKPALIIPHDYDQFDYAIRAELYGIAYIANIKNKKEIKENFKNLIEKKTWENLENLSNKFKEYKNFEILKNEIERLTKNRRLQ